MRLQATIAKAIEVRGIGLHSGAQVDVRLLPAQAGSGVRFHRTDVDQLIPALAEEAGICDHATTLGPRGKDLGTVEHLLSAVAGLGIDNLLIEVSGPEIPILDGSAAPWVSIFRNAGVVRQALPARPLVPSRTLSVSGPGGKRVEIRPARELRVSYTIDFPHPLIGKQSMTVVVNPDSFATHIARARTFGFLSEYELLKKHGLARGAAMDNCIVVGNEKVENGDLRFPDEFVRHKILDLLGDLALVGRPVQGHVIANRGGHALHAALARLLRDEAMAASTPEPARRAEA